MKKSELIELKGLLERLCDIYENLKAVENEKTRILTNGTASELIELMNTEQALFMESRNTEKKRIALCRSMEYKTLSELINSSEECREMLHPVYIRLSDAVNEVKNINNLNMKLLETRATTIRFLLEKIGIFSQNKIQKVQARA
jgi:hypothetical protein